METVKINFSHGINTVTDKRLVPDGFLVLGDNLDLRSGSLRPFKFPEPFVGFTGGVPAGSTCIYEFMGNWFFSTLYRFYESEYVSSQTRVYFSEMGSGHVIPQKIVNGVQAQLGSLVPITAPTVVATTGDTPSGFKATVTNTGGNLATGQYSYRISAIIDGNILPPAQAVIVNVPQVANANITTGAISLVWNLVPNATGYVIFGRNPGQEQTLFTMGSGSTTVTDVGEVAPGGAYAINYQPLKPLTYLYTYSRNVGTMIDESGPSPYSPAVNSSYTRIVSRNPLTDGFYTNGVQYTNATLGTSSVTASIVGQQANGTQTILLLSAAMSTSSPWWVSGQSLVIGGDSTNSLYTYSIPTPLATPSAPTVTQVTGTGLAAGTYAYAIAAIRGPFTNLVSGNAPATTAASATTSITTTTGNIPNLVWTGISNASAYAIYRQTGATWNIVAYLSGSARSYTDSGANLGTVTLPTNNDTGATFNALTAGTLPAWNNPTPSYVGRILVVTETIPNSALLAPIPTSAVTVTMAQCYFSGTPSGTDQDAIYITGANPSVVSEIATLYKPSSGSAWINQYNPTGANITGVSYWDLPNNGYYQYWNIYRAGDSGSTFALVKQVAITETSYTDVVGETGLGITLPTSYTDSTSGGTITFQPPPVGMLSPRLYNGMLFGIDGNTVRWTPTDMPDAWPEDYSQTFPFPPQNLVSYAGGLWVFCEDAIYRMDGFAPGQISIAKTRADGCVGPLTPKIVGAHLLYLAKRGIMIVSGMDAFCLTERNIPYRMLTEPSNFIGGVSAPNFWWFPTDHTSAYGAVLGSGANQIPYQDTFGVVTSQDRPFTSLIWEARSFVWQNKYFLYFSPLPGMPSSFPANPTWCVDLGVPTAGYFNLPNYPVTTMGFKPTDVHTSSRGECYAILPVSSTSNLANQANFAATQSVFNGTFTAAASPDSQGIFRFGPTFGPNVPIRFRIPEITAGAPHLRKKWREVRLNGEGTCQVRVFIDGALETMANGKTATTLVLTELPGHPARIMLPPGGWAYSLSIEVCGDASIRLIEIGFDRMPGDE